MRVLVLGSAGQLGKGFMNLLGDLQNLRAVSSDLLGFRDVLAVPRSVDITDKAALQKVVNDYRPEWIVNAAAYTQVDAAEKDVYQAVSTNAGGAANVAFCAKNAGSKLIYFSTESVFDGSSRSPYSESDIRNPLSVYSISKQAGEDLTREICEDSYVLRTSWLYGDSTTANFPSRLLLNLSSTADPVKVVTDLVGNPTPVSLLVEATLALMQAPPEVGTYNVCTSGSATKHEWAKVIAESQGFSADRIVPAKSSDFATPARRSQHVVLSCEKFLSTGLLSLPHWKDYYPARKASLL